MPKPRWFRVIPQEAAAAMFCVSAQEAGAFWKLAVQMMNSSRPLTDNDRDNGRRTGLSTKMWRKVKPNLIEWGLLRIEDGNLALGDMADFIVLPGSSEPIANDWQEIRRAILERDGEVCAYCRTTDGPFQVDHIVPRSRGGSHEPDNLTVACKTCNASKGALTPDEWLQRRTV